MRIAAVNVHVLEAPLSEPFGWSFNETSVRGSCIVEIVTEDGTTGWGECYGPSRINAAILAAYRPHLLGGDPLATDLHWQTLYNQFRDYGMKGVMISALSGVDIALWDLKGKILGQPVHRLMGGPLRREVRAYATGTYRLRSGNPLDYVTKEVAGYVREGFSAVKLKIGFGVTEDEKLIAAVRETIGPKTGLMLDANHGFDAIEAIDLGRRVARYDIGWFEEPVVPDDLDSYVEVRRGQPIPVAGGECEFTRWGFREVLKRRAMDIIQPDTCAAGGLSECKKIADMATAFGVRYLPHVWGTGIGLSASLQLLAALPHNPPRKTPLEPMLEFDRSEHPFRQAILTAPLEHANGVVKIPDAPGLGIDIDRAALEKFRAVV
ncbi:MAG TPA: mandelate racemase/muconate lactonizing enzyme family protein [Hyphomicrobiaceae bacterium]|nr:mandelate racemase/muconate lactonizing enzyme family protein [Hyphomicrobiaceae bacterium]